MNTKKTLTSIALSSLLSMGTIYAKESQTAQSETQKSVQKSIDQKTQDIAKDKRDSLENDAVIALSKTAEALNALDNNDSKQALSLLSETIGKLEVVVSAKPELALAPVLVNISAYDIVIDLPSILEAQRVATHLLIDGEFQQARKIIEPIRSEMVVTTTSLPLATYPDAIKAVVPLIKDGKNEEAKQALQTVISTVVVDEEVIPLPVLRAQMLLDIAETKAKIKRSKIEQGELDELYGAAIYQLALAEAMGYSDAQTYATFATEIKKIQAETSNKKVSTGFFDKIKEMLNGFGSSNSSDS